ncbi:ABC transporter ATP-binding protein [Propionibacterium sp.]|uniref:ABC transporter ATP-binding protein n=1 Tax=Propionibacterium sp. TaxID=1977903 RepID=UPI0039E9A03D
MKLELKGLSSGYGERRVINDLSLEAVSGEVMCLLGPNGVGKTTLFKTILGFITPQAGTIMLDDRNIRDLTRREMAQVIAYVPQAHTPPFPFSVLDVVTMGRTAKLGPFSSPTKKDVELSRAALERLGVSFLAERTYTEISGGERQMVLIARALTQEPQLLIMDEPTSSLDFGNQVRVLQVVRRLAEQGLCIVMTTHVPDHAFLTSARVALLQADAPVMVGSADEIVTEEAMNAAYGVTVRIATVPGDGPDEPEVKACVPLLSDTPHDRTPQYHTVSTAP